MEKARIRFLEELSFNAWPTFQTIHYDAWLLRFADGYTRRANSISPIYGSALNIDEKIDYCEQVYRARQQPVIFKITPAVHPENLDEYLRDQGYVKEAPTSVQLLSLSGTGTPNTVEGLTDELTERWVDAFCRMNKIKSQLIPAMRRLLNNIVPPCIFASLQHDDEIRAVGLGVMERGYLGIYDIVTDPDARRQGLGTRLMLNLLSHGVASGAEYAYLQVMLDNKPALQLYRNLGFTEVYQYWYRVKA
ncbi:MAG: GNAT family N-acetyltransferase [Chloroflexi bacterium]|nr:MAG: GNAT family N-acetyltransferase [Chloroflexota bacterium]